MIPAPSLNSIPRHSPQVQSQQMLHRCDPSCLAEFNPRTITSGVVSADACWLCCMWMCLDRPLSQPAVSFHALCAQAATSSLQTSPKTVTSGIALADASGMWCVWMCLDLLLAGLLSQTAVSFPACCAEAASPSLNLIPRHSSQV